MACQRRRRPISQQRVFRGSETNSISMQKNHSIVLMECEILHVRKPVEENIDGPQLRRASPNSGVETRGKAGFRQSIFDDDHPCSQQPASAFARSIGMRSKGWLQNLFEAGYFSATWEQNPRTNVRMLCVSETDVADFNKRFLTLTPMQAEFGLHRQTCAAILKAAGVHPFAPGGQDFGQLFERKEAEPVLLNARRGP